MCQNGTPERPCGCVVGDVVQARLDEIERTRVNGREGEVRSEGPGRQGSKLSGSSEVTKPLLHVSFGRIVMGVV